MDTDSKTPETPAEPAVEPNVAPEESADQAKAGSETEILDELGRLGTAFVQAVQAAWASDERKKLEQDLSEGLRSLADSVEEALEKVGKNEQVHEVLDKAEDVAESVGEKVRDSKVTAELADGLVKGLSAVTTQLQKLANDMQTQANQAPADAAPTASDAAASDPAASDALNAATSEPVDAADDVQDIPISTE